MIGCTMLTATLVATFAAQPTEETNWVDLIATQTVDSSSVTFKGRHSWSFASMSGIEPIFGNTYAIICDDRAKTDPARLALTDITINDAAQGAGSIELGPIWWVGLRDEAGDAFEPNTVDPESVRRTPHALYESHGVFGMIWSSEGRVKDGVEPSIFLRHASGQVDAVKIPDAFIPDDRDAQLQTKGIRHNRGFESIAAVDHTLIAFPESPLAQDERETGRALIRVQRFEYSDQGYQASDQLAYPFGPVPRGFDAGEKSGVVSVLAITSERWLVLERTEPVEGPGADFDIRLYQVDVTDARDASGFDQLKPRHARGVEKQLLIDMRLVRDRLPNGRIPNFEGMCLIPGRQALLMIADNDDGEDGPTVLAAFTLPHTVWP